MPNPALVNATDLNLWADRLDARSRFPQLIRRLILATDSGITKISFAAEEGTQLGGWDGITHSDQGNAFVPEGAAGWELGVNRAAKGKADEDYEKRTQDPLRLKQAETTFIFSTLRRWGGKDDWSHTKRDEGLWGEVRAYDADDLAAWLEQAPAVHVWISHHVGKHPIGIRDLETFWADWAEVTAPPLSPALSLAGRDEVAEKLLSWVAAIATVVAVHAESRDEALAIFAASIKNLPINEKEAVLSRTLVVDDAMAWSHLVSSPQPLILIPLFDDRKNVTRAVQSGHHVLIPLGRSDSSSATALSVPRPSREQAKGALEAMGLPEGRANTLAGVARRSMTSLRRELAVAREVQQPPWASPAEASALIPALLAGSWDESNPADCEIVAKLARSTYDQVSRALQRWAHEPDAPVRNVGTIRFLVSREDAWSLLSRYLTQQDLAAFEATVLNVLGEPDPRYDLPDDKRYLAGIYGKELPHSGLIRQSLAETLALMGARSNPSGLALFEAPLPTGYVASIVRRVLDKAMNDWKLWASLSDILRLLAEAAPDSFLEEVERGSSGNEPILARLFSKTDNSLFVSSPHTGLLWALEVVAWNPDYLSRAARALAKLAGLDPGGRLVNRPQNSLREIFLPWHPSTAANAGRRFAALDLLRVREPEVAWTLLCNLLPETLGGIAHPTAKPRWRDWAPDHQPSATWANIFEAYHGIIDRLVADAGADGKRWRDLIDHLPGLPPAQMDAIIKQVASLDAAVLDDEDREHVWKQLQSLITRHREFPDAGWAMSAEQIAKLDEIQLRFTPLDPVRKHAWLFTRGPIPILGRRGDWREGERLTAEARTSAAKELADQGGATYLLEIASRIEDPWQLGYTLGRSDLLADDEETLFVEGLASREDARQMLTRGFTVGRSRTRAAAWITTAYEKFAETWTPEQTADFFIGAPFEVSTWERVESAGGEVERLYWHQLFDARLENTIDCLRAVNKLLEHGRPHLAVSLLGMYEDEAEAGVTPELAIEALAAAIPAPLDRAVNLTMHSYYVGRLFDAIEKSGKVDEDRLAGLEWAYSGLLEHDRPPRILYQRLARSPEFFVEILRLGFKHEDEERGEVSDAEAAQARVGWKLLEKWNTLPGLQDDGSLDATALSEWVRQARDLAATHGRRTIADQQIGSVLQSSPVDDDGLWPHRAVRDLLEELENREIETGLRIAIYNGRGVVTRSLDAGGVQERALAEKYQQYAEGLADRWPRTAAVLRTVANMYKAEARHEDEEAELREDLGYFS